MAEPHAKRPPYIVALFALCAACWLVAPATSVEAATNAKQRVTQAAKKPDTKKREPNKPASEPALESETRKDRAAPKHAEKKPATKKHAAKKGKPVKQAAKAKRGKKPADDDDDDEDEKKPSTPPLTGDLAVVKKVIDLARDGETDDATEAAKTIADPAGQKL